MGTVPSRLISTDGSGLGLDQAVAGANLISWVFLAILGCLILAVVAYLVTRTLWRPRALVVILVPLVLYLITWFFVGAPQVRYSWAPLLLVGALPLAWAWQAIESQRDSQLLLMPIAQVLVGVELVAVVVISSVMVLPRLATDLPSVPVATVPLSSTVNLLVPQGTDQCWGNFPLCSGAPATGLKLRGGEVSEGFASLS